MRGVSRASAFTLLLAPALAGAAAPVEPREESVSSAYIVFDLPNHVPVDQLDFGLDVRESSEPCGPANVAINGQHLPEGGAGTFSARRDTSFTASWNVTCLESGQEQLMSLSIDSVTGIAVTDLGISLRFRQVAPMAISNLKGPASMALFGSRGSQANNRETTRAGLAADLDELDSLHERVAEIHRLIFAKERLVAETYGWVKGQDHGLGDCQSIGCVVKTLLDKVTGAAASLIGDGRRHHRHHRWRGPPRWWRHRHHRHGGRGCGHGNHTSGDPPSWWQRPHYRHGPPPLPCKCETEQEASAGAPAPVSTPSSFKAPGHGEWSEPLPNHPLYGSRPGRHGRPQDSSRPSRHPQRPPATRRPSHESEILSIIVNIVVCFLCLAGIFAVVRCKYRRKRDAEKKLSWWQRFKTQRDARKKRRAGRKAALKRVFARLAASLASLQLLRSDDDVDAEKETILSRRQRRPTERSSGTRPPTVDDDNSDADTTVAEEIAGLRVAADVVSDIIAAEEGRARSQQQQQQQQQQQTQTQAPTSLHIENAYYMPRHSSDTQYSEALPAYEASESSHPLLSLTQATEEESVASSIVADGFMYTPGSSDYTPGSRNSSVAGAGSADALGDTKS